MRASIVLKKSKLLNSAFMDDIVMLFELYGMICFYEYASIGRNFGRHKIVFFKTLQRDMFSTSMHHSVEIVENHKI